MSTAKPAGSPWESKYELMLKEVPKNEKERKAAEMLHDGGSLIESMLKSGLTHEEFNDLYERLKRWEDNNLVKRKPTCENNDKMNAQNR